MQLLISLYILTHSYNIQQLLDQAVNLLRGQINTASSFQWDKTESWLTHCGQWYEGLARFTNGR